MADAEGNRVLDAKINGSKALFNDPLLAIEGEGRTRGWGEGGREIIYRMCKPQRVGGLREGRRREGERVGRGSDIARQTIRGLRRAIDIDRQTKGGVGRLSRRTSSDGPSG